MPKRSEPPDWEGLQRRVIGLGEHSHRKNHFAVLQERLEELERSRAVLKAERDLSQLYLDTVPAIVVVLDPAGRVTMINPFGCRLLGHQAEALVGRKYVFTGYRPTRGGGRMADGRRSGVRRGAAADSTAAMSVSRLVRLPVLEPGQSDWVAPPWR